MSALDRERIVAAIHNAESKTSSEIVCVLAHSSADAKALPIFLAAVAALLLPWLLVAFTTMPTVRILILQLLVFAVLTVLLCLPRVRVALMPNAARRAVAHHAAMEQFVSRGLTHRSGILIFVSFAERYARIVVHDAIAAHVPDREWRNAIAVLVDHVRDGEVSNGLINAIDICGAALAAHFPRTETIKSDLPNRVYVI